MAALSPVPLSSDEIAAIDKLRVRAPIPSELPEEDHLDNTTLLIIIIVVIIVFGGGWYGRGRWF